MYNFTSKNNSVNVNLPSSLVVRIIWTIRLKNSSGSVTKLILHKIIQII